MIIVLFSYAIIFNALVATELWQCIIHTTARPLLILLATTNFLAVLCFLFKDKIHLYLLCFIGFLQITQGIWAMVWLCLDISTPQATQILLMIESILFALRVLMIVVRLSQWVMMKSVQVKKPCQSPLRIPLTP
jgi:hypothetical protein